MKYYNHTPGPWRVNQSCGPGLTDIQIWRPHPKTGLYVFIANAGPDVPATEPQERLANAYLIAAAPELLEALELLVSEFA